MYSSGFVPAKHIIILPIGTYMYNIINIISISIKHTNLQTHTYSGVIFQHNIIIVLDSNTITYLSIGILFTTIGAIFYYVDNLIGTYIQSFHYVN